MAVPEFKDLVGNAITSVADAGEGTITLAGALAPASDGLDYVSFATAYAADATVYVTLVEGTEQSVEGPCTYTHSGTTLTRGTVIRSTTGARLAMTSAGEVFVTPQATQAQQNTYRSVDHTAVGSNITLTANAWNYVTIAGLTANRDALLPATFNAGDWVGVHCVDGDASYELLLKPNTGDTINGGSAGAEWSRLFIAGERVLFRATTADSAWVVEDDGRIPCNLSMYLSTDADGETAATWTAPTACSTPGAWTEYYDVGGIGSTSAGTATIRRAGNYRLEVRYRNKDAVASGNYAAGSLQDGSSNILTYAFSYIYASGFQYSMASGNPILSAGTVLTYKFNTQEGGKGAKAGAGTILDGYSAFSVQELLT